LAGLGRNVATNDSVGEMWDAGKQSVTNWGGTFCKKTKKKCFEPGVPRKGGKRKGALRGSRCGYVELREQEKKAKRSVAKGGGWESTWDSKRNGGSL